MIYSNLPQVVPLGGTTFFIVALRSKWEQLVSLDLGDEGGGGGGGVKQKGGINLGCYDI